MREIKFRAWDKDAGCMLYSNSGDDEAIWRIEWKEGIVVLTMQTVDSFPGGLYHEQENKYLPADVEIMQFTGLLDKNGKGNLNYITKYLKQHEADLSPVLEMGVL